MKTRSKSHSKRKTRKGGMDALTLLIGTSILYGVFGGIANAVKSRYNSSESTDALPNESILDDSMPNESMLSESPSAKKGGRRTRRR